METTRAGFKLIKHFVTSVVVSARAQAQAHENEILQRFRNARVYAKLIFVALCLSKYTKYIHFSGLSRKGLG